MRKDCYPKIVWGEFLSHWEALDAPAVSLKCYCTKEILCKQICNALLSWDEKTAEKIRKIVHNQIEACK
jgi:hypothetical protein